MKINTINYFIVDALKSIKRNITVSFAAMLTVLVTFFVLGTFTLVGLNFNKTIEDVADKIEIKVYLQDDIKLVNQREVEIKLSEQDGVKAVTYESKDEAFTKLKKDLEGNREIAAKLKANIIPYGFLGGGAGEPFLAAKNGSPIFFHQAWGALPIKQKTPSPQPVFGRGAGEPLLTQKWFPRIF